MNRNHFIIGLGLLILTSATALGQKPVARPTPAPQVPTQPSAPIPTATVAVIYSQAFIDPKTGITRFSAVLSKVNAEFDQRQKQLDAQKIALQQLQAEIAKMQNPAPGVQVDQKILRAKADEFTQKNTTYTRDGQDAQQAYAKRRDELLGPLNEEIGKALEVFAKAHGITVIIDGSQVPLVYAADNIDITTRFIADFNSKNSTTASTATRP